MSDELARELKLHVIPQTQYCKPLLSSNGSELIVTGHVKAELYLRGLKVEHHMEVAKSLAPPFILGRDFLSCNVYFYFPNEGKVAASCYDMQHVT